MKTEDLELVIIKDIKSGTFCAYPKCKQFKGIVVQADKIEDIPIEIARSFEVMFRMAFDKKMYDYIEM